MTANQHLRRRADYSLVAESQEEHVWRRIDRTQSTIDLQRIAIELCGETLRQHHLVTVARSNMILYLSHTFFKSSAGKV